MLKMTHVWVICEEINSNSLFSGVSSGEPFFPEMSRIHSNNGSLATEGQITKSLFPWKPTQNAG